jgi:hypothetical protein
MARGTKAQARGKGNTTPYDSLTAKNSVASTQLRFTATGPIKPQVLQPQNRGKFVADLEIPANFDA